MAGILVGESKVSGYANRPADMTLVDPFGRKISYVRVSVTDRCDLRCAYCMSERQTFLTREDLLSRDELDRLCPTFIGLGTRRIRLKGGAPPVRTGFLVRVARLSRPTHGARREEPHL